mmetsp:Transcript_8805/g.13244  ORF Transcript_8805/g.13244 Transcript_8805/m.13244 type:complete len:265 (-) Transcript_8805:147-941(-)
MICFPCYLGCIAFVSILAATLPTTTSFGVAAPSHRHPTQAPQNIIATSSSRSIRRSHIIFSLPSEFGAISASDAPPRLNPTLIEAALTQLPWETGGNNSDDEQSIIAEEIGSGKRWYTTRQILTRLWVLPRDMSNGSWESYAIAANNGEDKMLSAVPQLLRLNPEDVEKSAKTVLKVLRLPPALLRKEPLLLAISPDRLIRGFESLLLAETREMIQKKKEGGEDRIEGGTDEVITGVVREACKDTPGLLLGAASNCGIGGISAP